MVYLPSQLIRNNRIVFGMQNHNGGINVTDKPVALKSKSILYHRFDHCEGKPWEITENLWKIKESIIKDLQRYRKVADTIN